MTILEEFNQAVDNQNASEIERILTEHPEYNVYLTGLCNSCIAKGNDGLAILCVRHLGDKITWEHVQTAIDNKRHVVIRDILERGHLTPTQFAITFVCNTLYSSTWGYLIEWIVNHLSDSQSVHVFCKILDKYPTEGEIAQYVNVVNTLSRKVSPLSTESIFAKAIRHGIIDEIVDILVSMARHISIENFYTLLVNNAHFNHSYNRKIPHVIRSAFENALTKYLLSRENLSQQLLDFLLLRAVYNSSYDNVNALLLRGAKAVASKNMGGDADPCEMYTCNYWQLAHDGFYKSGECYDILLTPLSIACENIVERKASHDILKLLLRSGATPIDALWRYICENDELLPIFISFGLNPPERCAHIRTKATYIPPKPKSTIIPAEKQTCIVS